MKRILSMSSSWLLAAAFTLTACSANSPAGRPMKRDEAVQAISEFKLLNERGEAAAPAEWTAGKAPFGVFLRWDEAHGLAQCNVSQIVRGYAVTNAHCVSKSRNALHQIVFYDRNGKLRSTTPVAMAKIGRETFDDVALFKISSEAAALWDTVSETFPDLQELIARSESVRGSENVVIWALDPLPELGARFAPRQCVATQSLPRIGMELNGAVYGETDYKPANKTLSSSMHLYLSGCVSPTVLGNSGALITSLDFVPRGIFHWELVRSQFSADEVFLGADGTWNRVSELFPEEKDPSVLQFGSRLFPFLGRFGL